MNKTFRSAPWDSTNSTYKQIIHFENGKSIVGYSKRSGFAEPRDKKIVLQNWILRSFKDGYLDENNYTKDEVKCIEYHWRKSGGFELGFILYQDYVEWNPSVYREYLDEFLIKFLDMKKEGANPYERLYITNKSKAREPLNLMAHRFLRKDHLRKHCLRIIKDEIMAVGEVQQFYINYCNKWFEGYDGNDEEFFKNHAF